MLVLFRSFPRMFWCGVIAACLCSLLSLLWELLLPGSPSLALLVPVGTIAAPILAILGRVPRERYAGSTRLHIARRRVPWLFSLTCLSQIIGIFILIYYELVLHIEPPRPSWADFFQLAGYPLSVLYFSMLPTSRVAGEAHMRRFLDSLLILGSLVLFSWYFIIGPILLQGTDGITLGKLTLSAYNVGNLLLIYWFLQMAARTSEPSARPAVILFGMAVLVLTFSVSIYAYMNIQHIYVPGGPLDLGLQAGYLLFGLATLALRLAPEKFGDQEPVLHSGKKLSSNRPLISSTLSTLLPYFLFPLVGALFVYIQHNSHQHGPLDFGVYVGCILLILVLFLRQLWVLHEVRVYARKTSCLNEALAQANAHLEALSSTDPLTNLPNHRALISHLEQALEEAHRNTHPVCVLFFDGDRFKRINDTYGHSVGDAVLRELGSRVQSHLRTKDVIGRYGGEEFVVVLPDLDLHQGLEVAERLRLAIATQPLVAGLVEGGIHGSISIGLSVFPYDGQTASELLDKADQAMYWAKRLGRNQIKTVQEARYASQDSTLASTIVQLERPDERIGERYPVQELQTLLWMLDLRDRQASFDAHRVSDLAAEVAREMGCNQEFVLSISASALLHDIGKLAIPDDLLHKKAPLTEEEEALIRQHPELGAELLASIPSLQPLMDAVRYHHENWDGSGYPVGLKGEEIPLAARIIRMCVTYHALLTDDTSPAFVLEELQRGSGTCFDPVVVVAAIRAFSRLEDGTKHTLHVSLLPTS